jgi:hypothetical protein
MEKTFFFLPISEINTTVSIAAGCAAVVRDLSCHLAWCFFERGKYMTSVLVYAAFLLRA